MSRTATVMEPAAASRVRSMHPILGFTLIRKIAEGGCAEIYEARDIDAQKPCAIKILHPRHMENPAEHKRMLSEGALGLRLRHCPHIVRTLKVGKAGKLPFIAFELIPGVTLRELLREKKMLPDRELLQIARAIGAAVKHMHDQGLYHKDIKPDNIMLDGQGTIKLIDLGFAETFTSVKFSFFGRKLEGSPAYMAPELIRTKKPSPATDLYALGCTLYEAATGAPPYRGDSEQQILAAQTSGLRATPIGHYNRKLSPQTQKTILALIEKDPAHRHKSVDEFMLDLARHPLLKDTAVKPHSG